MQRSLATVRRTRAALALCSVTLVALLSFGTAIAFAGYQQWGATSLPGHIWDGSGMYVNNLYYERVEAETTSTVCIGPVQKSGTGYITPLGWKCNPGRLVSWEHAAVTGEMAVYNPNAGTIPYFSAFDAWIG